MNLPNYITLFRILLVPFFFTALVSISAQTPHERLIALGILIAACLSDALDGFIARLFQQQTKLGTFLDPLADKLILLSGFLGLLTINELPYKPSLWITVTIVFRDIIILVGLVVIYLLTGKIEVVPNFLGKATTALQMATLICILFTWSIALPMAHVTAGLTILSCLSYLIRDLKKVVPQ